MSYPSLKVSTVQEEGDLHASKWLKHQFLLSQDEIKDLFDSLSSFYLVHASGPVQDSAAFISVGKFLDQYRLYVEAIQSGSSVDISYWRRFFCNYLTVDPLSLYKIVLADGRVIIKACRPVLQMQLHTFFASELDGKFHSMVMASDSIHFGLQISYPQIFEDPKTHEFSKTSDIEAFPNTALFKQLIQYLRHHTVPTPFLFRDDRSVASFRLGRQCFSWINNHSGLINSPLKVLQR